MLLLHCKQNEVAYLADSVKCVCRQDYSISYERIQTEVLDGVITAQSSSCLTHVA